MIGIIFDCDGTLIDSELAHFLSWQKALQKRGNVLTEEEYYLFPGNSGAYISQKLHERTLVDSPFAIRADKNETYLQLHREGIPPIERTVKFVRQLYEQKERLGIKLAVASAAHKAEILLNIEHLGLRDHFDAIVSGADDLSHYDDPEGVNKPKPYIYLHTAKLLGLEPSQCIAFEDSNSGVLAATRAGMITFAVPNAFTKRQDFSQANFVIDPSVDIDFDEFFQKISCMIMNRISHSSQKLNS
jgi:HAD superfamily hydrolase (TIGR01509 family)